MMLAKNNNDGGGEPGVAPYGVASRTFSTNRRKWPSPAIIVVIFCSRDIYCIKTESNNAKIKFS